MSSRPECEICYERVTMGGCKCGEPWFGFVKIVDGKRTKDERPHIFVDGKGWIPKEEVKEK